MKKISEHAVELFYRANGICYRKQNREKEKQQYSECLNRGGIVGNIHKLQDQHIYCRNYRKVNTDTGQCLTDKFFYIHDKKFFPFGSVPNKYIINSAFFQVLYVNFKSFCKKADTASVSA